MSEMGGKMLLFFAASSFVAWIILFVGLSTRRELRRRNERETTRTTGVIVDYVRAETRMGKRGQLEYRKPVIEFTADGQSVRGEYDTSMGRDAHPIGETVDVLYDVSDPSRFHLAYDPVYADPGGGAIRLAVIWIAVSAALTVALAVFVGGATFDLGQMWRDFMRTLHIR